MATPTAPIAKATALDAPSLPPAATFDILPPLHQLLSRLLAQSSSIAPPADGQDPLASITAPAASDSHSLTYKDLQPLDIQHLAQEASRIKIRIQKARQAVKGLPDLDRTVEDQTDEIEDLEKRCEDLRVMLGGMAGRAGNERYREKKMVDG